MRPRPGEVLHFSEDPTITRFVPHVAATAQQPEAYVWAVSHDRAPDYWFPRDCPRGMAWTTEGTTPEDKDRIIGPGCGTRVHAVEYGWLKQIREVRLYAYRLPQEAFQPFRAHAMVATKPVEPLGPPERVPDLLDLHEEAGIGLRVLPNLWDFWDAIRTSTLAFSGIRMRNARPRESSPSTGGTPG